MQGSNTTNVLQLLADATDAFLVTNPVRALVMDACAKLDGIQGLSSIDNWQFDEEKAYGNVVMAWTNHANTVAYEAQLHFNVLVPSYRTIVVTAEGIGEYLAKDTDGTAIILANVFRQLGFTVRIVEYTVENGFQRTSTDRYLEIVVAQNEELGLEALLLYWF